MLKRYFRPDKAEKGLSLSIVKGEGGARLSHSHERQFYFALQSLSLWRNIVDDMFRLWHMAEEDLLSETVPYSLQDTGQGMQRVQQSPRTYKAMQDILLRVQSEVSQWIGSSVIHLGDHNVPNALSFIDKYTQGEKLSTNEYGLEEEETAATGKTDYELCQCAVASLTTCVALGSRCGSRCSVHSMRCLQPHQR